MKDDPENGERADDATYEDEHTSRRTVTIPLRIVNSPSASWRSLCSFLNISFQYR